jgi:dihydropteroate synthase
MFKSVLKMSNNLSLKPIICGKYTLEFNKTLIMGILNVTPDSFSDGNLFLETKKAVEHAKQMVKDGADIIDIGGESSKPGSDPVSEEEELKRVKPVIEALAKELNAPISIDSYKPKVVDECIKSGASLVNDINGLRNQEMINVAAKHKVPVIIMHMQGDPKTMQENPQYNDIILELKEFFNQQLKKAREAGINGIVLDPGIGFGKTLEHNLQIVKRLNEFKELNCPILIGPSRKSFIGKISGLDVGERLEGTLASVSISIMKGANIVRVHDVKECKRAVEVVDAVKYV